MIDSTKDMIDIASGRKKADLLLKNCKTVNVFSHEIIDGDIGIGAVDLPNLTTFKTKTALYPCSIYFLAISILSLIESFLFLLNP